MMMIRVVVVGTEDGVPSLGQDGNNGHPNLGVIKEIGNKAVGSGVLRLELTALVLSDLVQLVGGCPPRGAPPAMLPES